MSNNKKKHITEIKNHEQWFITDAKECAESMVLAGLNMQIFDDLPFGCKIEKVSRVIRCHSEVVLRLTTMAQDTIFRQMYHKPVVRAQITSKGVINIETCLQFVEDCVQWFKLERL